VKKLVPGKSVGLDDPAGAEEVGLREIGLGDPLQKKKPPPPGQGDINMVSSRENLKVSQVKWGECSITGGPTRKDPLRKATLWSRTNGH